MPDVNYGSPTINGEIQISASTALPTPGATQTLRQGFFSKTGNTAETIITPTSGKTFYLMGLIFVNQSGSAQSIDVLAADGTTTIMRLLNPANTQCIISSSTPICSYTNALPFKVKDGDSGSKISAWGFEQ